MKIRYSFSSRMTRLARNSTKNDHRRSFPILAKEVIRISDIVLEVLDAKFIENTRNKVMESLVMEQGKILIYVLNKSDLADLNVVKENIEKGGLKPYVIYSCKKPIGRNRLRTLIRIIVKKQKFAEKHAKAHVGVIGYPNTGKSSLINTLAGKGRAGASSEFGFTRGIKKIRFNKDIIILDTPGVFGEKENIETRSSDLKRQAEIGVRTASSVKNPEYIVFLLVKENPVIFDLHYNVNANGDSEILIESVGRSKGFIRKGNEVDIDKTARYILNDWQKGRIKNNK